MLFDDTSNQWYDYSNMNLIDKSIQALTFICTYRKAIQYKQNYAGSHRRKYFISF